MDYYSELLNDTTETSSFLDLNEVVKRRASQNSSPVRETSTIVKDYNEETGYKMINQYIILQELGKGSHGKVKLGYDTIGDTYVNLKPKFGSRLNQSLIDPQIEKVKREIAILKKCIHPHVVQLFEVLDDPNAEKVYLGEIKWQTQGQGPLLSIDLIKSIFRDIVLGDIKPANILWTRDSIAKITDFGVSHITYLSGDADSDDNEMDLNRTAGSPAFFAPELCQNNTSHKIGKEIDIWALGVTLYCFAFGKIPFEAENEFELLNIIPYRKVDYPENVDPQLKDLFEKLLEKDPSKRITIDEIKVRSSDYISMHQEPLFKVQVSSEDVKEAVTIRGKIKNHFRRFSASIQNLANSLFKVEHSHSFPTKLDEKARPSSSRSYISFSEVKTNEDRTCFICNKLTNNVLRNDEDFFFVCVGHLDDNSFCKKVYVQVKNPKYKEKITTETEKNENTDERVETKTNTKGKDVTKKKNEKEIKKEEESEFIDQLSHYNLDRNILYLRERQHRLRQENKESKALLSKLETQIPKPANINMNNKQ
ncbi:kinase-like protein [Rozella allomycis CSF55]|uniref:Kinase-like protein n=1 Tax=Rozella allomycis (strain CSF55) TaxID=988480 RepID=A0A075B382_ROZAC|nr:Serine/threonine-dual specificity protein kinase domain-containing protein [Rozella allomycis CSF55]RKP17575.1 kinase-like protein [Rozella allomycis CSF55]|eukprot:EPZ37043.1 Serine/threonine-dual specificity protein kinase domain-containing protein [Rozella allomycis CSF55]